MNNGVSDGRYRTYFQQSPVPVFVADLTGQYVDVNEAACALVGYDRETLLSMSVQDLTVDETDPGRVESFERLKAGDAIFQEDTLRHAEGHAVDILFDAVAVEGDRIVAYCRDITERKQEEQRVTNQRDSLEVLNQLLRHDIRNDLQVVSGYVELLEELCEDPQPDDYLETVRQHAEHADDLTNVGRELAEAVLEPEDRLRPVSLEPVVDAEVTDVEAAYPEATVTVESLPSQTVVADKLLGSVVRNLLQNAIQHNTNEAPRVRIDGEDHPETVRIRVVDNGPGVDDARKDAIFQQGERATDSQGTGLGLYLVKTLVETYGGDVWIEDATDETASDVSDTDPRGAAFTIELQKSS